MLLFPVALNIVLVNIGYNISNATLLLSIKFLAILLFIFFFDFRAYYNFFIRSSGIVEPAKNPFQNKLAGKLLLVAAFIALIAIPVYGYRYLKDLQNKFNPQQNRW